MSSSSSSSAVVCRSYAKTQKCPNGSNCFMMHITDRTEAPWRTVRPVSNASLVQMQSQRQASALTRPEANVRSTSRPTILMDRVWGSPSPAVAAVNNSSSSSNAATVIGTRAIDRLALLRLESRQSSTATATPSTKTELYKTELCRSWSQTQSCPYGSKCQFAHGSEELRPVQRHPKYKTIECNQWAATGKCTFGNRCVFIHDESERQGPKPTNVSAGRPDVSSWIVSDNATPYVAPSSNAPSTDLLSKRFSRIMVESNNAEDDLIKRIQNSFPMFGELLKKPAPISQQTDDQSIKVTTRTL